MGNEHTLEYISKTRHIDISKDLELSYILKIRHWMILYLLFYNIYSSSLSSVLPPSVSGSSTSFWLVCCVSVSVV